ncbi:hypothetical protein Q7P35_000838 [Cladosporium inversicolor]
MSNKSNNNVQKFNFNDCKTETIGKISKQVVDMDGCTVRKIVCQPGASWSSDLKPVVGGDSCQLGHVGLILKGVLLIKMDNGKEMRLQAGEVGMVPPGHDTLTEGDSPAEWIEFSHGCAIYDK